MPFLTDPPFVVADAGARYGLHPSWMAMEHIAEFHLFEADPIEAGRLEGKYQGLDNVIVRNLALDAQPGSLTFELRKHRALTSSYQLSKEAKSESYLSDEFSAVETFEVQAQPLDTLFAGSEVHFLKLDVEGAELRVLEGAGDLLANSIQAVRSEVCFAPVYDGAPLFGDLDEHLRSHGFVLLNLDYDGRGVAQNGYTLNNRYGRLISTDAVWIRPTDQLLARSRADASAVMLRQAAFLLLNGGSDFAIEALEVLIDSGQSLEPVATSALYAWVKRQLAILFKELHYVPQMERARLTGMWDKLFNEPFPELNQFWESIDQ